MTDSMQALRVAASGTHIEPVSPREREAAYCTSMETRAIDRTVLNLEDSRDDYLDV
jgi:hypothetical protein